MDWSLFIILAIIFVATLIRSTFGFGDALFAMPILAFTAGIKTATPLMALVGFSIALTIIIIDIKKVEIKSAIRLVISSFIGIPVGLLFFKGIDEDIIKIILGVLILLFSAYNLFKTKLIQLKSDKFAWIFGFTAGILGAAYNTSGPPVIIYGTIRKWNPKKFRASLQAYFLPTGFMLIIGHIIAGNITKPVVGTYLYSLPLILLAIFIGNLLNKKIPPGKFNIYIYVILIILGAILIINSL